VYVRRYDLNHFGGQPIRTHHPGSQCEKRNTSTVANEQTNINKEQGLRAAKKCLSQSQFTV